MSERTDIDTGTDTQKRTEFGHLQEYNETVQNNQANNCGMQIKGWKMLRKRAKSCMKSLSVRKQKQIAILAVLGQVQRNG